MTFPRELHACPLLNPLVTLSLERPVSPSANAVSQRWLCIFLPAPMPQMDMARFQSSVTSVLGHLGKDRKPAPKFPGRVLGFISYYFLLIDRRNRDHIVTEAVQVVR